MLMENTKGTADSVFTLWEVAKVTEEFFNACNGTNIMYLPPQEYQPQPRKECADAPPLASHSITLPTRGLIMRMMRRKTKTSRTTTGLKF
jgi:hypothetical protein